MPLKAKCGTDERRKDVGKVSAERIQLMVDKVGLWCLKEGARVFFWAAVAFVWAPLLAVVVTLLCAGAFREAWIYAFGGQYAN